MWDPREEKTINTIFNTLEGTKDISINNVAQEDIKVEIHKTVFNINLNEFIDFSFPIAIDEMQQYK